MEAMVIDDDGDVSDRLVTGAVQVVVVREISGRRVED